MNQSLPEQASKQRPSGASASEQTLPHGILQWWAGTWKYKLTKSLPPLSCFWPVFFITTTEKKPEQNQGDEPRGRTPLWIVLNFIIKERERPRLIFKLLGQHHRLTHVTGPSEAPHSLLGRSAPDRMPAHVSILTSLGQACWLLYVLHLPLRLFSSMTLR